MPLLIHPSRIKIAQQPGKKGENAINTNIYVGNLALETTAVQLSNEFKVFGEVVSVSMMNDKYIGSGQPRGYGYVEMASKSEAKTAIARLHGKELNDRVMTVVEALPVTNKSGTVAALVGNKNRPNKKRDRKYKEN